MAGVTSDYVYLYVAVGLFDRTWIPAAEPIPLGYPCYSNSVWIYHSTIICAEGYNPRSVVTLAWSFLGTPDSNLRFQSLYRIRISSSRKGLVMTRSTLLLARPIWFSLLIAFLVFFGLELVFRILDEAKSPHVNYTTVEIGLVSISGMPRRLYLDLPLIVLISVAAGLGGLAQSSELTILRAAGLSIRQIFFKIILVLAPIFLGSILIAEYGMPAAERFSQALKDANVSDDARDAVWTLESGRFVFVEGERDGSVRLWRQIEMADSRSEIERIVVSRTVRFDAGQVDLAGARTLSFGTDKIIQQTGDLLQDTNLTENQVRWLVLKPDSLSLSELWYASNYLQTEGLNARAHIQLFWQRLLLPVVLFVLTLLALATAFGSLR